MTTSLSNTPLPEGQSLRCDKCYQQVTFINMPRVAVKTCPCGGTFKPYTLDSTRVSGGTLTIESPAPKNLNE